jgi:hypothetical protein
MRTSHSTCKFCLIKGAINFIIESEVFAIVDLSNDKCDNEIYSKI